MKIFIYCPLLPSLSTNNDSGMLFCVAFEGMIESLHRDAMLEYRILHSQTPWKEVIDSPGVISEHWRIPNELNYRQEMLANWAKELFFNPHLRLEKLEIVTYHYLKSSYFQSFFCCLIIVKKPHFDYYHGLVFYIVSILSTSKFKIVCNNIFA